MKTILLFIMTLIALIVKGQNQLIKKLNLSNNGYLSCSAILATSDSGFALAGTQDNVVDTSLYKILIKYNKNGDFDWCKKYPNAEYFEFVNSIYETNDNKFILTGHLNTQGTYINSSIIDKVDNNGNPIWRVKIGTNFYVHTEGKSSVELYNDIYTSGNTYSQQPSSYISYLFKLNSSGSLLWKKIYTNIFNISTDNLFATQDGNLLMSGSAHSPTFTKGYLMKLDTAGNIIWLKTYSTTIGDIFELSNGNFLFLGLIPGLYLAEVDHISGNIIWCKKYKNLFTFGSTKPRLTVISDNEYIVTNAFHDSSSTGTSFLQLDSMGNQIGTLSIDPQVFGPIYTQITHFSDGKIAAYSYQYWPNDNFANLALFDTLSIPGICGSNPLIINDSISTLTIDSTEIFSDDATFINYTLESTTSVSDTIVDSTLCNITLNNKIEINNITLNPNPCRDKCTVYAPEFVNSRLELFNMLGYSLLVQDFNKSLTLDVSNLPPGVYIILLKNKNEQIVKIKFIKLT